MTRLGLIIAVLILVADQLTKWLILRQFEADPSIIPVLPFFNLVLVYNKGVSFGMFQDLAWGKYLFTALALFIVGVLFCWLRTEKKRTPAVALGLVMGGAVGNVIDRQLYGAVVDFIDIYAGEYHWPAFNVADAAVCVGAFLLCVTYIFAPDESAKNDGGNPK